ncbi:MAG TPA: ATP-binding cassette domain-containing protein [Alphaproteobacteria bacterium]|nr:amino acid ABC transporter ATP-binding protein [Alphaproteobacteria bacterium]HRK98134.1 ATP-binding cassette domain-containing protein [Alphaproteobacteria bacterium]
MAQIKIHPQSIGTIEKKKRSILMLSVRNLHKSYGDNVILNGIDLDIEAGHITCAIGPSGTGKTTLLRLMCQLEKPNRGEILIDEEKNAAPWPKVTAVFQSLFLWPHLTLRENIMLPARNHNPEAEKDIEGLIKLFEMEAFINNYPNQSSVGQRQRVALARALIINPKYVLLDEITSALDVEQTAKILTKLSHLKERGIGIFLITHHISFAQKAADKVIFLDGGKIVEQGSPDILAAPTSHRLQDFLSLAKFAS